MLYCPVVAPTEECEDLSTSEPGRASPVASSVGWGSVARDSRDIAKQHFLSSATPRIPNQQTNPPIHHGRKLSLLNVFILFESASSITSNTVLETWILKYCTYTCTIMSDKLTFYQRRLYLSLNVSGDIGKQAWIFRMPCMLLLRNTWKGLKQNLESSIVFLLCNSQQNLSRICVKSWSNIGDICKAIEYLANFLIRFSTIMEVK